MALVERELTTKRSDRVPGGGQNPALVVPLALGGHRGVAGELAHQVVFGAAIALVSCHHGFHCQPGAEGVGRAATNAFVHSFVLILILDLFLGIWLNNVHDFFRPEGPRKLL